MECYACRSVTTHRLVGFIPLRFVGRAKARDGTDWANCAVCTECAGLTEIPVTQEQVKRAHDRYLRSVYEAGIMDAHEIKEETGVDVHEIR